MALLARVEPATSHHLSCLVATFYGKNFVQNSILYNVLKQIKLIFFDKNRFHLIGTGT